MKRFFKPGPRNLITDIPGLYIGNSEHKKIKTGVTVLIGEKPFTAGVKILGGAPGTRETDLLNPDKIVQEIDSIVLSGGSAFGLEAASGIVDELSKKGRGFTVRNIRVPIVPSAILFDLNNNGNKTWEENPYNKLGKQALKNASSSFSIGSSGVGFGATTEDLKGGLGSASFELENNILVGAIAAVNSVGTVTVGNERHFWAAPFEMDKEFGGLGVAQNYDHTKIHVKQINPVKGESTTLGIVATNARIDQAQAKRIATAAHAGIARAILPSHTPFDGDIIFAVTTGEIALTEPILDVMQIGNVAANCITRSIARAVFNATYEENDLLPSWSKKFNFHPS